MNYYIAQRDRKTRSAPHDTISNGFIDSDTTFLRSSAAKRQFCWTHMRCYLFPRMVNWTCYK